MSYAIRTLVALLTFTAVPHPGLPAPVPQDTGPHPSLTIHNALAEEAEMVQRAVARFAEVGLDLPPLVVTFHDDRKDCDDFNATFRPRGGVAIIEICKVRKHTVLHELGHAWEHYYAGDEARERFMDYLGLTKWNDADAGWGRRAIEKAAVTIALVLNWKWGATDDPGFVQQLCGYEALTGGPLPGSVSVDCAAGRQSPAS